MIGAPADATLAPMGAAQSTRPDAAAVRAPERADPLADLLPGAMTATHQAREVAAGAATTWSAIREAQLDRAPVLRALVRLRALPGAISRRAHHLPPLPPKSSTIDELIANGWWIILSDAPPRELCLGVVLWDERTALEGQSRAYFDRPAPGAVRVGWSLRVEPLGSDRCLLVTETRADPVDEAARRRFRAYWTLISPFAAFTRRLTLRGIARAAEGGAKVRA